VKGSNLTPRGWMKTGWAKRSTLSFNSEVLICEPGEGRGRWREPPFRRKFWNGGEGAN